MQTQTQSKPVVDSIADLSDDEDDDLDDETESDLTDGYGKHGLGKKSYLLNLSD